MNYVQACVTAGFWKEGIDAVMVRDSLSQHDAQVNIMNFSNNLILLQGLSELDIVKHFLVSGVSAAITCMSTKIRKRSP